MLQCVLSKWMHTFCEIQLPFLFSSNKMPQFLSVVKNLALETPLKALKTHFKQTILFQLNPWAFLYHLVLMLCRLYHFFFSLTIVPYTCLCRGIAILCVYIIYNTGSRFYYSVIVIAIFSSYWHTDFCIAGYWTSLNNSSYCIDPVD